MEVGKIIPNGVVLQMHEMATVVFLTGLGYDIELIPKSNKSGVHTADIRMLEREWEIKCPRGEGSSLIKNTLQKAARQSENVIIDLSRTKRHQSKCLREIRKEFVYSHRIKRIKVITKMRKVLDLEK